MEHTELSSITFVPSTKVCGTIPRLEEGCLHVEVKCNPAMEQIILWHEGAHVYLFHLGYPPCQFQEKGKSYLLGHPVDFVAEYLATKLELERRYSTQSEREKELRQRLDHALLPIPIRGLHVPQPGAGKLAISAAMCTVISQQWTNTLTDEAEKTIAGTIDELKAVYKSVVAALQQTPSISFGSSRLTNETVQKIKAVLSASFNEVYRGVCTIQFII